MREKGQRVTLAEIMAELDAEKVCAEAVFPLPIASQKRIIAWLTDVLYGSQMEDLVDLKNDYEKLLSEIEESRRRLDQMEQASKK